MQEFITIPTYLIEKLKDKPYSKLGAYIDILNMAEESGGEFETTRRTLENRWGWSGCKVNSFLSLLEEKTIIKPKKNQRKTTITIVNSMVLENTEIKERPKKDQEKTIKNPKSEKEQAVKKEQMYYPNDELLDSAFKEFLVMRNKIKKPIATKQALTRMMNRIEKLSGGDNDLAIKILNQSTDHCWQDVYELKEDKQNYSSTNTNIQNQSKKAKFERLMNQIKEDEEGDN